jgi:hypothetical protein
MMVVYAVKPDASHDLPVLTFLSGYETVLRHL